jgi:hypothetical protein
VSFPTRCEAAWLLGMLDAAGISGAERMPDGDAGNASDAARLPPKRRPCSTMESLRIGGQVEPAAIFGGMDEVSNSQLRALLGALRVLAAEDVEDVI